MTARTLIKLVGSGLLAAVVGASQGGDGVIRQQQDDGLHEVTVVSPELVQPSGLRDYYELLASKTERPADLFAIWAFANRDDSINFFGKTATEFTYDRWKDRYASAKAKGFFPVSQLIAIRGDAVLRSFDGEKSSTAVLSGKDPTRFGVGQTACEILAVTFLRLPTPIRKDGKNPVILRFWLETHPFPALGQARLIARRLQQMLAHPEVRISMRTDPWFIESTAFPVWYPFAPFTDPPSAEQYRSEPEVYCWTDGSAAVQCR